MKRQSTCHLSSKKKLKGILHCQMLMANLLETPLEERAILRVCSELPIL
jgi:hypothetical protein